MQFDRECNLNIWQILNHIAYCPNSLNIIILLVQNGVHLASFLRIDNPNPSPNPNPNPSGPPKGTCWSPSLTTTQVYSPNPRRNPDSNPNPNPSPNLSPNPEGRHRLAARLECPRVRISVRARDRARALRRPPLLGAVHNKKAVAHGPSHMSNPQSGCGLAVRYCTTLCTVVYTSGSGWRRIRSSRIGSERQVGETSPKSESKESKEEHASCAVKEQPKSGSSKIES